MTEKKSKLLRGKKIPPRVKRYQKTYEKQEVLKSGGWVEDDENKYLNLNLSSEYSNYSEKLIDSEHEGQLTPLYADVTISLRPASHYTDNAIINFSSNKRTGEIAYNMTKIRNESLRTEVEKKKEKETDSFKNQKSLEDYLMEKGVKTPEELIQNDPYPSLNPDLNSGLLDLDKIEEDVYQGKEEYLAARFDPTIDGGELNEVVISAKRIPPSSRVSDYKPHRAEK